MKMPKSYVTGLVKLLLTVTAAVTLVAGQEGEEIDARIVQAVSAYEAGDFNQSTALYLELFRQTGEGEYLIRAARQSLRAGGSDSRLAWRLQQWLRAHPKDPLAGRAARVLGLLWLEEGALERAHRLATEQLSRSEDPRDQILGAKIALKIGDYAAAVRFLHQAFLLSGNEDYLIEEAVLIEKKLHDPQRAAALLENYLRRHPDANVGIHFRLIALYTRMHRSDLVLRIYRLLYRRDPEEGFFQKIVTLYRQIGDSEGLMRFIEAHPKGHEAMLWALYLQKRRYDKALDLAQLRYKRTGDPCWLGREGVALYARARSRGRLDSQTLSRIETLFEKALRQGLKDLKLLDFYARVLIDEAGKVRQGIRVVRQALRQAPDNPLYLDTLAWGLYRQGDCKSAWKTMLPVVNTQVVKDHSRIRRHLQAIRRCLKNVSMDGNLSR